MRCHGSGRSAKTSAFHSRNLTQSAVAQSDPEACPSTGLSLRLARESNGKQSVTCLGAVSSTQLEVTGAGSRGSFGLLDRRSGRSYNAASSAIRRRQLFDLWQPPNEPLIWTRPVSRCSLRGIELSIFVSMARFGLGTPKDLPVVVSQKHRSMF